MPSDDPRLSSFGNERIEQLARERAESQDDSTDDISDAEAVLLIGVVFLALTPPGWVGLIYLTTDRTYPEAVTFLVATLADVIASHFELLVVVAVAFSLFSEWLEQRR